MNSLPMKLASWNAQALRVTLFLRTPMDGANLWEAVVGSVPEMDEYRPREKVRRQSGVFEDAQFEIRTTESRLDWLMTPVIGEDPTSSIHFGLLDAALERFDGLVRRWLDPQPAIVADRVAFGLVAAMPTLDRTEGHMRLHQLVPSVRFDPEHTTEVLYRVNRPKVSRELVGAELNRITTWSCAVMVMRSITFTMSSVGQPQSGKTEEHTFVRCECDNSTPAETSQPLETGLLLPIYTELRQMAVENIERGEVP